MENQSLVEIINGFSSLDKKAVSTVSERIIDEYDSGNVNTEVFIEKLEFMLQSIEGAMAVIRQKETEELLRKYGDTQARAGVKAPGGSTLKVKEVGVRYDYSNTEAWQRIQAQIEEINQQKKALETQLKAITKPQAVVDEETGEVITYYPAIRTSTTALEISLKKA